MKWIPDNKFNPSSIGWYAALKCWDSDEGQFPSTFFWDGKKWDTDTNASLQFLPEVFDSPDKAEDWAYKNDPGF